MLWQTVIHLTFGVSAVALAVIDRYLSPKSPRDAKALEANGHDPDGRRSRRRSEPDSRLRTLNCLDDQPFWGHYRTA